MADAQTPARQCHRCHSWVWLPNWWRHAQRCELREPANARGNAPDTAPQTLTEREEAARRGGSR